MSEPSLFAPLSPFSAAAPRRGILAATAVKIFGAPSRWLQARHELAELAHLSEREWHDIGAGPRDPGCGYPAMDDEEDRAARRVALKAWRSPIARAA